ncbi:hypothetical protein ILUMI_05248 [Ignelater luminosus]|uniref:Uncharacterized protein n=1 Tax=Ignelater luminosus TaxID=2038154 RepID=A0A8K0D837_IGNLU|nr:hypothetical protein ILUMI_05248 [Ignelater luminosus]
MLDNYTDTDVESDYDEKPSVELSQPWKVEEDEPKRKWTRREKTTNIPDQEHPIINEHISGNVQTGVQIFLELSGLTLDHIVFQSKYAVQRGKNLNPKKEELLVFLGINFEMGYRQLLMFF